MNLSFQQKNTKDFSKKYLSDSSIIFSKQSVIEKNQKLKFVNQINIFQKNQIDDQLPELKILQFGFDLLNIRYKIIEQNQDEIFIGKLPILQLDNYFFEQNQFIDIILKLFFDELNQDQNNFMDQCIINKCRYEINNVTKYFMLIEPDVPHQFLDPYWLLLNPIKKINHFYEIKKIKQVLEDQGFSSYLSSYQIVKESLDHLQNMLIQKNNNQEQFNRLKISDVIFYYYLEFFMKYCPRNIITKISGEYQKLFAYYYQLQKTVCNQQFEDNIQKKLSIQIIYNQKNEIKKQYCHQNLLIMEQNKNFISLTVCCALLFIYHKFGN